MIFSIDLVGYKMQFLHFKKFYKRDKIEIRWAVRDKMNNKSDISAHSISKKCHYHTEPTKRNIFYDAQSSSVDLSSYHNDDHIWGLWQLIDGNWLCQLPT